MGFEIEFDPDALKDLKKLDQGVQRRLIGFLRLRVATLKIGAGGMAEKPAIGATSIYRPALSVLIWPALP